MKLSRVKIYQIFRNPRDLDIKVVKENEKYSASITRGKDYYFNSLIETGFIFIDEESAMLTIESLLSAAFEFCVKNHFCSARKRIEPLTKDMIEKIMINLRENRSVRTYTINF